MRSAPLLALAALAAPLVQAASVGHHNLARHAGKKGARLPGDTFNKGSTLTGLEPESKPEDGQTPSTTDDANFINFCSGQTITNGKQNKAGSCNPIPMGQIPSTANMVSTIITSPQHGDVLAPDTDFTITIDTDNLATGQFTNPEATFFAAPQQLTSAGHVIGHAHITVQAIGDLRSTKVPPPDEFAFFGGLNEASDDGVLSADVEGGLPAGAYRLCTLVAAANHQPVLMPVAQRGAQDDCVRFEVVEGGGKGGQVLEGVFVEVPGKEGKGE